MNLNVGFALLTREKTLTGINVAEVSLVLDIVHECVFGVEASRAQGGNERKQKNAEAQQVNKKNSSRESFL